MKKKLTLGQRVMAFSLFVYHVWGTMLVFAVVKGREGLTVQSMFEAVCLGISTGLLILYGGKAAARFAPLLTGRGAAPPVETEKK